MKNIFNIHLAEIWSCFDTLKADKTSSVIQTSARLEYFYIFVSVFLVSLFKLLLEMIDHSETPFHILVIQKQYLSIIFFFVAPAAPLINPCKYTCKRYLHS